MSTDISLPNKVSPTLKKKAPRKELETTPKTEHITPLNYNMLYISNNPSFLLLLTISYKTFPLTAYPSSFEKVTEMLFADVNDNLKIFGSSGRYLVLLNLTGEIHKSVWHLVNFLGTVNRSECGVYYVNNVTVQFLFGHYLT